MPFVIEERAAEFADPVEVPFFDLVGLADAEPAEFASHLPVLGASRHSLAERECRRHRSDETPAGEQFSTLLIHDCVPPRFGLMRAGPSLLDPVLSLC